MHQHTRKQEVYPLLSRMLSGKRAAMQCAQSLKHQGKAKDEIAASRLELMELM